MSAVIQENQKESVPTTLSTESFTEYDKTVVSPQQDDGPITPTCAFPSQYLPNVLHDTIVSWLKTRNNKLGNGQQKLNIRTAKRFIPHLISNDKKGTEEIWFHFGVFFQALNLGSPVIVQGYIGKLDEAKHITRCVSPANAAWIVWTRMSPELRNVFLEVRTFLKSQGFPHFRLPAPPIDGDILVYSRYHRKSNAQREKASKSGKANWANLKLAGEAGQKIMAITLKNILETNENGKRNNASHWDLETEEGVKRKKSARA